MYIYDLTTKLMSSKNVKLFSTNVLFKKKPLCLQNCYLPDHYCSAKAL